MTTTRNPSRWVLNIPLCHASITVIISSLKSIVNPDREKLRWRIIGDLLFTIRRGVLKVSASRWLEVRIHNFADFCPPAFSQIVSHFLNSKISSDMKKYSTGMPYVGTANYYLSYVKIFGELPISVQKMYVLVPNIVVQFTKIWNTLLYFLSCGISHH